MGNLYATDFYGWTQEKSSLLRQGKLDFVSTHYLKSPDHILQISLPID